MLAIPWRLSCQRPPVTPAARAKLAPVPDVQLQCDIPCVHEPPDHGYYVLLLEAALIAAGVVPCLAFVLVPRLILGAQTASDCGPPPRPRQRGRQRPPLRPPGRPPLLPTEQQQSTTARSARRRTPEPSSYGTIQPSSVDVDTDQKRDDDPREHPLMMRMCAAAGAAAKTVLVLLP
eukprot:COSAG01_NODE_15015_length_1385_cov_1.262830_1_plen_175_part_01